MFERGIKWFTEYKMDELFKELNAYELAFTINADSIISREDLFVLGKIRSFTYRGCIGYLVFNKNEAQRAINNNTPYIYYYNMFMEYGKEVIKYLEKSTGVVFCQEPPRHMVGIVSQAYYGTLTNEEEIFKHSKDRWVSISPGDGCIYRGKQEFHVQSPMDNLVIKKLYKYLKKYVLNNPYEENIIKAWDFLDIILDKKKHNDLFYRENYRISNHPYPCYFVPDEDVIYFDNLKRENEIGKLIMGLNVSIRRTIGHKLPLGQHNKFFRPLFNPMEYIRANEYAIKETKYIEFIQFTGLEFFDLEKYYKGYFDIHNIKIFFETNVNYEWGEYKFNYLDFSNPKGVDIILNALPHRNVLIYVNDIKLEKEDIFSFYNMIRKRELMWE